MLTEDRVREIVREELEKFFAFKSHEESERFILQTGLLVEALDSRISEQSPCKDD